LLSRRDEHAGDVDDTATVIGAADAADAAVLVVVVVVQSTRQHHASSALACAQFARNGEPQRGLGAL